MVQNNDAGGRVLRSERIQVILLLVTVGAALLAAAIAFLGVPPPRRLWGPPAMYGALAGAVAYVILYLWGWRSRGIFSLALDFASTVLAGLVIGWAAGIAYYTLINPPQEPNLMDIVGGANRQLERPANSSDPR